MSQGYVLVADDSAVVRKVLGDRLGEQGWEVREAADGAEALARALEHPPEVVLLDIEMPRLNGYQVLAAFKAEVTLRDVPVIFLTARGEAEQVAEGLRRGAHDYLRKPFETVELLGRCTRHGAELSLVLLDLDRFKELNDTHGHAAGDDALRQVADRLRSRLRRENVAGRWGGEEFMVLLPDTDGDRAAIVAESLRAAIAGHPLELPGGPVRITVSAGVAEWSREDADTLVRRADAALYDAKGAGRNAVRRAGAPAALSR